MKSTVTMLLVGLLFVSGFAFAQGMRVENKKVEDPKKVEDEAEIEIEFGEPEVKKTVQRRVIVLGGDSVEMKGKVVVVQPDEKAFVIEKEGTDDLAKVIADLKALREKIRAAKSPEDLEMLAKDLQQARVRVQAGQDTKHRVFRWMGKAHPQPSGGGYGCTGAQPKPAPRCPNCAPRPPACPHCGPQRVTRQAQPGPMGPMMPMMLNGLRQSIDGLRGEIAGLRQEIRSIRGAHAPKSPGAYHYYGAKGGAAGVAVKKAPPKHVAPPPKGMVVGKKGVAFVARAPVKKPDPRQAKLEKEVKNLRAETAHLKAMMAELLRKMDAMQKANETKK